MTASPLRAAVRTGAWILLLAVLTAVFYLTAPGDPSSAARPYLSRARSLLGEMPAGSGRPHFSSTTSGIGLALAAAEEIGWKLSSDPRRSAYLDRTEGAQARALRGLWALLAAGALLSACVAAHRGSIPPEDARAGPAPRARWVPAAAAGALLLAAPLLPVAVGSLSPALPAGLLLLLLGSRLLLPPQSRPSIAVDGVFCGILLAWYPFAWPLVLLHLILRARRDRSLRGAAGAAALALFLGLALEPSHLVRPGSILEGIGLEWRRAGGWPTAVAAPGDFLSVLLLNPLLGAPAVAFALFAAVSFWRSPPDSRMKPGAAFVAGVFALCLLLPALAGVRRVGVMQQAAGPLVAAWGAVLLGRITQARPAGRAAVAVGFLVLVGAAVPARLALQERSRTSEAMAVRVGREAAAAIGPHDLWLSEISLPGLEGEFAAHGFVLPRDSRVPGRYDFAYWPRWYAGFRWVLLSEARVDENLARDDARVPDHFYRTLLAEGRVVRQWGGSGAGYRLYRIPDDAQWRHPLTEQELKELNGGREQTWFLNSLGGVYLAAGDLDLAGVLFRQGIEWDPHSPGLYNNLGTVYLRQGDMSTAGKTFEEGLRRAPNSIPLLFNLARACNEEKLYDRAEDLLRRVLAIKPDYAPAHYELARTFLAEEKEDLAARALRRYLELDPSTPKRSAIETVLADLAALPRAHPQLPSSGSAPAESLGRGGRGG